LAGLFASLVALRRLAYRRGWLSSVAVGVPVIVVGNITAGGSGKTPLTIWLVRWLRTLGLQPGVVSRGYGGTAQGSVVVQTDSHPATVGDEPLLIRQQTAMPVVVGRDRVAAAQLLLARHPEINIIVSDDGLQHYRLRRDIELAVVDAATGLGNGWPLPAGPLREPASRLRSVDAVIQVFRAASSFRNDLPKPGWRADYRPGLAYRLHNPQERKPLCDLPRDHWLAVTGIGRPQGFFDMLQAAGIRFTPCAFEDHHAFQPHDIPAQAAVLMTEKDAVKCSAFAGVNWWVLALDVAPEPGFVDWLKAALKGVD
jgi:tetraacyldisaccharide 4'-kinase